MVEENITDGKRIAQFLASELTGLETGALSDVAVSDADPEAEPSPDGSEAYRITYGDDTIASVVLFPSAVEIHLDDGIAWSHAADGSDIAIDGSTLTIEQAAAVKQAIDRLQVTLASNGPH